MSPSPACEKRKPRGLLLLGKQLFLQPKPLLMWSEGPGTILTRQLNLAVASTCHSLTMETLKKEEIMNFPPWSGSSQRRGICSRQQRWRGRVIQALETEVPDTRHRVAGLGIYSAGFRSRFGSSITSLCPHWLFLD